MSPEEFRKIQGVLASYGGGKGFEIHGFKIGWYNVLVRKEFVLPYHYDTVAFLVISQPNMFENTFIPYLKELWATSSSELECKNAESDEDAEIEEEISNTIDSSEMFESFRETQIKKTFKSFLKKIKFDPLDQCMQFHFQHLASLLPDHSIEIIHDFEMDPHRRPKILVQTAGHVSGAAYLYRREDLWNFDLNSLSSECSERNVKNNSLDKLASTNTQQTSLKNGTGIKHHDPWPADKNIFPLCLHPNYGGWFSLRGVLILKDVTCPELQQPQPRMILTSREQIIELLQRFNTSWQDSTYRDIIPVKEKYSEQQIKYFSTPPKDRRPLLLQLAGPT